MHKKFLTLAFAAAVTLIARAPAQAADVICYNCPPQWADFASMLKAIKADLGLGHSLRQQEFRPGAVAADRREEQPGRRRRSITASISA